MSTDTGHPRPLAAVRVAPARRAVRAAGFWLAVSLPLVYLPLLSVPAVGSEPSLLVGTLTLNLVALAVGHGHEPTLDRGD